MKMNPPLSGKKMVAYAFSYICMAKFHPKVEERAPYIKSTMSGVTISAQVLYDNLYNQRAEVWGRLAEGKASIQRLMAMAKNLSGLADRFHHQLQAQSQALTKVTVDDMGTTNDALQRTEETSVMLSQFFEKFFSNSEASYSILEGMRDEIEEKLEKIKTQAAKIDADMTKSRKKFTDAQAKAQKCADALGKAQLDLDEAKNSGAVDPSKLKQLEKRVSQAQKAFHDADAAHATAAKECADKQAETVERMRVLLTQAAELDAKLIQVIREQAAELSRSLKEVGERVLEMGHQYSSIASSIQVESDMRLFVSSQRTGSAPEAPVYYVKMEAGQTIEELLARRPEQRSSYEAAVASSPVEAQPVAAAVTTSSFNATAASIGVKMVMLYDFDSTGPEFLGCTKGTAVQVLETRGDGWSNVSVNGREGLVPTNYLGDETIASGTTSPSGQSTAGGPQVGQELPLLYDFDGQDDTQLTVAKGQMIRVKEVLASSGWVVAELVSDTSKSGYVPISYIV